MPRAKIPSDLRSLARTHTYAAIRTLAKIMTSPDVTPGVRVAAANILLDRGWGRPVQPISGEGGPIIVEVVRFAGGGSELRIIEPAEQAAPPLIEASAVEGANPTNGQKPGEPDQAAAPVAAEELPAPAVGVP